MTAGPGAVAEPSDLTRPTGAPARLTRDPADLFERHGAALLALAMVLLGDRERAEGLATDAILDACAGPVHLTQGADRWELARYVYVRSQRMPRGLPSTQPQVGACPVAPAALDRPSGASVEHVALALAMFGGHSHREVATLLRLPADDVAALLLTASLS